MNLNDYSITMSDISPKATVLLVFEIKLYHPVLGSDWMSVIFSVFFLFACFFFLFPLLLMAAILEAGVGDYSSRGWGGEKNIYF